MKRLPLLLGALFAAGSALLAIQAASAHSRPIRFDPAPGTVLAAAPASVTGWFTAELRRDPNWTFLRVTDQQGNRVDTGEATLSADRLQMTVNLRSGLGPGRYLVTWRTYDDGDGRIFGDCYVFFVGQAAADASIAAKYRLDAGRDCQRIDVGATDATPAAGGTPQATAVPEDHADEDEGNGAASDAAADSDGIPAWGLALGVVAGLVAGGVGGRMIGRRG